MANNSDGSIVIDTELDNSGFEKGSDRMLSAINRLLSKVDSWGGEVKQSFSGMLPMLQSIAQNTEMIYGLMSSNGQQAAEANQQIAATQEELAHATAQASQTMQQQGRAVTSFVSQAGAASSTVSGLEREISSLSNSMTTISRSAELGFSNGKAVLSFDAKLRAMEQKLSVAKKKLEDFGNTKIPTEDFTWLQQNIAKAEAQLNSYIEKQIQMENSGGSRRGSRWRNLQAQIEQTTRMLETYKSELQDLENSGEAFTLASDTQQYDRMRQELQNTEAALQKNRSLIDSESIAQARLNVLAAQEQVARAKGTQQQEQALIKLREAQTQLHETAAASSNTGPKGPGEETVSGWQKFGTVMKNVAANAGKVVATLAKATFNGVAKGAKKATSALKSFVGQSTKTAVSTKSLIRTLQSLKNMMIRRLKYSFISSIMDYAKTGIQSLAKFSASFNKSMSNIMNSAKQMGGNLAVSMGNLISAVEPVITKIINLLSTAISYINAFFALLSGKKTMIVAKKSTDSYADSVGGAAEKQKELNKQVYGFDELNKRNKESSSGSGAGSGGAGVQYEEVPIDSVLPDSVQDFFQKIKDAIEAGNWYGVGQVIADGLNTGMKAVDAWINSKFRPMGVKWAGIIAEALNGLVDGFNWNLLGKTIADGLNAAFDMANTFLTTFHFETFGNKVGMAINSFFENTKWDLLGQTIANGIMAAINFAYGVITEVHFLAIGEHIAELLSSALEKANFKRIGETIGGALRGAVQTAFGLISNIKFDEVGEKIKAAAQALLDKMNEVDPTTGLTGWQELGTTIADLANGIVQAFESVPWGQVASGIAETIGTALSKARMEIKLIIGALIINGISKVLLGKGIASVVGGKIGEAILLGLQAAWTSLGGLIKKVLTSLGVSMKAAAGTGVLSASAGQIGAVIIAGLFVGLEIGKQVDRHIIGPLIEAFGGDELTAEMYKNFHWFGEGGFFDQVWDGNDTFLGNVQMWCTALGMTFGDAWDGIKTALSGAWDGIKTTASTAWTGISSTISGAWSGVKTSVSGVAESVRTGLSTTWDNVKSTASGAWTNVKTAVTTAFTNTKTSLGVTAAGIKTNLGTTWSNVKSNTGTAWNEIKNSTTTAFTNAKTTLASTASNIKTNLSTTWNSVKSNATQTWNGIKTSVSTTFTGLKSSLTSTADNIKSSISTTWTSVKSTASSKWTEIKSTVSEKWDGLKDLLKKSDWTDIGSNLVSGLLKGIKDTWNSLTSWVGDAAEGLTKTVKKAFDINSPSRVWAEIGQYLDAGLLNGLEAGQRAVVKTAAGLAQAVTAEMSPDIPELSLSESATVDGLDAVAEKLVSIADTFRAITDMLASIGGFTMPQIATGTVVPYQTKISPSTPVTLSSDGLTDSIDGLDERMADQTYILKQLLAAVKNLNLNVDLDALTRMITKQQRDRQLNFGG